MKEDYIELAKLPGRRYAVLLFKDDAKYLLNLVRAEVRDGHFAIKSWNYIRKSWDKFGEIDIEHFGEVDNRLYGIALDIAERRAMNQSINLVDLVQEQRLKSHSH